MQINAQKQLLAKFVSRYPEMENMKNIGSRLLWKKATLKLNQIGPARTTEQWMRVLSITLTFFSNSS